MKRTNRNRRMRRTAAILALLLTLTSCQIPHIQKIEQADPVPAEPEPVIAEPETEPPETEVPETEVPETEAPETEAPETEAPEPVLPANTVVYSEEAFYTKLGDGLSRINLPLMPYVTSNIEDGKILVGAEREDSAGFDFALVDLDAHTIQTAQYPYEDTDEMIYRGCSLYLMNGRAVLMDLGTDTLCVYDETLTTWVTSAVPYDTVYTATRVSGDTLALSADGTDFPAATLGEDGTFTFFDLPLTATAGYDDFNVYAVIDEDHWLVSCFSSETYDYCSGVYTRSKGEITPFRSGGYNINLCRGMLVSCDYRTGEIHIYDPARPEAFLSLPMPEEYYLSYSNTADYLYLTNDGEGSSSVIRYDPATGLRVDEIAVPVPEGEYAYLYSIVDYGGDTYFISSVGGIDTLCRWESDEEGDGRIGFDLLEREDNAGANRELVDELYEKYGVTVYTGTDAVRYMYGYAVLPETDDEKIHDALLLLKEFFEHTPEGFMQEVVSCYSSLDICLTGRIIPELGNRNSINDATAFTTETNGIELAVFDINQSGMDLTVAHEFMHIFENTAYRLAWDSPRELEMFSRWSMFNPPEFEYRYIYTDEDGNTYNWDDNGMNGQFWEEGEDPDEIYFVDGYSMTYPTEDMARIFENIAMAWKHELPGYFAGHNMQLKAAYLAACLRDAFSSITDDTVCVWEEHLNPDYTLECFRENYDLDAWMAENAKG